MNLFGIPAHVRAVLIAGIAGAACSALASTPAVPIDFNHPERTYKRCPGASTVFYEWESGAVNAQLSVQACRKFITHRNQVLAQLPAPARASLSDTRYFLMLGEKSVNGGQRSGMRFVAKGSSMVKAGYDLRWEDGIVVYSTTNLLYLSELWTRKAILHELAHAWHLRNWPPRHAPMEVAWQRVRDAGMYRDVRDVNGKIIPSAYALTNALEYFAELSAAYFVGINYFPYDRKGLLRYDPAGAALVKAMWSAP